MADEKLYMTISHLLFKLTGQSNRVYFVYVIKSGNEEQKYDYINIKFAD